MDEIIKKKRVNNKINSFGFLSKKLARHYDAKISRIRMHLTQKPKVLEVDFGRGSFVTYAKHRLWSINGAEINKDLVDKAKAKKI